MLRIPADTPFRRKVVTLLPVLMWGGLLAVVSVLVLGGNQRNVATVYHEAALDWISGEPLYASDGAGFLYLPSAAVLYVPFTLFPEPWGEILWRVCGVVLLAWGVYRLSRIAAPNHPEVWLGVAFISVLLAANCVRNGQSTIHMTAAMLLAASSMYHHRWAQSAAWLALGFAIKPLLVVMILLAGAVVPRMRIPLALGLAAALVGPYLFQYPGYVTAQYQGFTSMLDVAHDVGVETWWAQVFGMLKAFGLDLPEMMQTILRLVTALATLGLCVLIYRRLPSDRQVVWLVSLSVIYLLLLNPRTENNTYAMLGPILGLFYAEELVIRNRRLWAGGLLALGLLALGSYELGKFLSPTPAQAIWLAPLACCLFCVYLGYRLQADLTAAASTTADRETSETPEISTTRPAFTD